MPKIYPPSLTTGPGKRVGTGYSSGAITNFAPNIIKGLGRNDRSLPFSGTSVPTNLYFDISKSTTPPEQEFKHVYLLTENVQTIEVRAAIGNPSSTSNLYTTPGFTQGKRIDNGTGENRTNLDANTNYNVWKLNLTGTGTIAQIRITAAQVSTEDFYVYACYFLKDPLLTLQNDANTSFSAYRATSNPRTGTAQEDLYGTTTYQQSVNRSDKRQVNFTVWRIDNELRLVDQWINRVTRAREQYPNIILDEEFLTRKLSRRFILTLDSSANPKVYPATIGTSDITINQTKFSGVRAAATLNRIGNDPRVNNQYLLQLNTSINPDEIVRADITFTSSLNLSTTTISDYMFEYSSDGTNWHINKQANDIYVRSPILTTDFYSRHQESNDPENFYPATWSAAVTDQIEGSGAKSVSFQFQQS